MKNKSPDGLTLAICGKMAKYGPESVTPRRDGTFCGAFCPWKPPVRMQTR